MDRHQVRHPHGDPTPPRNCSLLNDGGFTIRFGVPELVLCLFARLTGFIPTATISSGFPKLEQVFPWKFRSRADCEP